MKSVLQKLERIFRHALLYPLLRFILRNPPVEACIDLSSVQSLLLLRYDKLGDMIVTKPILRLLKKRYPKLKLGIVTSQSNAEILENDDSVDEKHVLRSNPFDVWRMLRFARRERYDVVMNLIFNRTTTGALLANIISPRGIKIGQGENKYHFYFNKLIMLPRSDSHMVEVLANYVSQAFGLEIGPEELDLFYEIDGESEEVVNKFLDFNRLTRRGWVEHATRYVVLNLSAGEPSNKFTINQVIDISKYLCEEIATNVVLIFAPYDAIIAGMVEQSVKSPRYIKFPREGKAPLAQIASLIQGCLFVITPDTAIVHLASAVQTPTFAVFSPLLKSKEWFPFRVLFHLLTADENKPVSSIPSARLIEGIRTFSATLSSEEQSR